MRYRRRAGAGGGRERGFLGGRSPSEPAAGRRWGGRKRGRASRVTPSPRRGFCGGRRGLPSSSAADPFPPPPRVLAATSGGGTALPGAAGEAAAAQREAARPRAAGGSGPGRDGERWRRRAFFKERILSR